MLNLMKVYARRLVILRKEKLHTTTVHLAVRNAVGLKRAKA